ncbi:hypothetical protein JCM10207_002589 [Rhodosporidiobolus poonsookiae]
MAGAAATAYASALGHATASPSSSRSRSPSHRPSHSRSSSLSSISSSHSHPAPGQGRARSPSISGDTDDLMSDDDPLTQGNNWGFDARTMERARCDWGDCGLEFWEIEPLVEHVHSAHAFPDETHGGPPVGKKGASYICDWAGCPRRGKTQGSKFALVAHLRSHTGEKPFHCPRPECDKSFTRTDALQKHMRVQHGDNIVAARKPPGSSADAEGGGGGGGGKKGKKKKGRGARADSEDSAFGAAIDDAAAAEGGEEAEVEYAPDEVAAMHAHPELGPAFVGYVVGKAKRAWLMREHEGLANELEGLQGREAELRAECEELVRAIMRKEVGGAPASTLEDRSTLERFLTSYAHEPLAYPPDFVSK